MVTTEQPPDTDTPKRHDQAEVLRSALQTMSKHAERLTTENRELRARVQELELRIIEGGAA